MSLSEARRLADDLDAIATAPEARLAAALWSLSGREASPDDGPRRLRLSSEMVTRLWAERPTSHPT